jgi:16S rRNA (cytidine1402-2'-O)-methyltransferase
MSNSSVDPSTLYVVATPIGNLADITARACAVLAGVNAILAEDTRVSATLLRHHGIATPVSALHQHNEARRGARIIERLAAGESLALISDAGTPGISDPGAHLVREVRAAGHPVVPIPGPSALTAALSVAGIDGPVLFAGFLPSRASARQASIRSFESSRVAWVAYESPHRLEAFVADLVAILEPTRPILIARELTKRFESVVRLPVAELPAWLAADPNHVRGEFVVVIEAPPAAPDEGAHAAWPILDALLEELPLAQAVRLAQKVTGARRNDLYAHALQHQSSVDEAAGTDALHDAPGD